MINETFWKVDAEYHRHGLTAMRFPPGSGDLNPIENVWSKLKKGLAIREFCIILKEFVVKGVVKSRTKQQKFMFKLLTADFKFFLVVIDKTYGNFWAQLFALPWLGAKRNWDFFLFFLVV